jgi:hypothetical protein
MARGWTQKLESLNAAQLNGILVFEALDRCTPKHIQVLAESLLPQWNVQIVANYRHVWMVALLLQRNDEAPTARALSVCA